MRFGEWRAIGNPFLRVEVPNEQLEITLHVYSLLLFIEEYVFDGKAQAHVNWSLMSLLLEGYIGTKSQTALQCFSPLCLKQFSTLMTLGASTTSTHHLSQERFLPIYRSYLQHELGSKVKLTLKQQRETLTKLATSDGDENFLDVYLRTQDQR